MQDRPYQTEARAAIHAEWDAGHSKTLLVLPTGCHAKGEKILMASGHIKPVEDIKTGQLLMGMDGTPRRVLHVVTGLDALYKVTPIKGTPFFVTGDHKLTLVRTNECATPEFPSEARGGEIVDVSVKEWLMWSKWKKHVHKLIRCDGIGRFNRSFYSLPIAPYFLGVLLGDGGITQGINITTPDREVEEEIYRQAQKYGMDIRTVPAGKATTYHLHLKKGQRGRLCSELKSLGLMGKSSGDKFIPHDYKTSDWLDRLQMVAGLIDSDGASNGAGGYDFVSKSEKLANDLAFMCRSLGLAAYVNACTKTAQNGFSGKYFRVSISGDCSIIPCRVDHKKAPQRKQKKSVLRTGFSVEQYGIGQYFGFTVDKDNRYLLHDFTVTHNCGKTIVFSRVAEDQVKNGERVLILAHRGELLEQAADKLNRATGLNCAVEKAEETSLDSWFRVTVGSVQSLMRPKRLAQFKPDHYGTIIVDEAHHVLSDGYQRVLSHFDKAKVLGVTATPDRGDMRNLGKYFDSLAYEYTLPKAIRDGYLCPIKAVTIPLQIDLTSVKTSQGDYNAGDLGTALDPYLDAIADEMAKLCAERKTIVFLPLIKTSQKFCRLLNEKGFRAAEVNGESEDRAQILQDFADNKYNVLCNSMLLTEGYDQPDVDCIVMLRPTKVRSLYAQCVGRGTRLAPGKTHLLLPDFLWMTTKHELCRPAALICENDEVAQKMTENMEASPGMAIDIEDAMNTATQDVVAQREEALAKALQEMRHRKRKLVDPLQFEMSIQAEDLSGYVPSFGWEMGPASEKQKATLEKMGIFPDEIESAGKAKLLLDRLNKRRMDGLTTPKQIRFLEGKGFQHVGTWQFDQARKLIDRIAGNGWRVPYDIVPGAYVPAMQIKEVAGWTI